MKRNVIQMRVMAGMTVGQLVSEMERCGVLGAGKLARAVSIMVEMMSEPSYTVFLAMAGPMIPGGLRRIVGTLIDRGLIDVIVTSGSNVVHDIMEGLGYLGVKGSFWADDSHLKQRGLGRAGDIYFEQAGFEALEEELHGLFHRLSEAGVTRVSVSQLLREMGVMIEDEHSFLRMASERGVPVFSPGILDSMIGLHLWTFNQLSSLELDPVSDLSQLASIVYNSDMVGSVILGGGLPKHHTLGANILRDGVDAALQITLDRPEGGGFSGAPLEEAISWRKVKDDNRLVTVIGDATTLFPIIVAAVLEKLEGKE